MSVLLLTNPFAPPPASGGSAQADTGGPSQAESGGNTNTVQPSPQSGTQNDTGSSTSNGGTGAGAGGSGAQTPLSGLSRFARPLDATPSSVVNAQVTDRAPTQSKTEEAARQSAIGLMAKQRETALLDGLKKGPDAPRIVESTVQSDMPDPLPTSPFLKGARSAA